MCPGPRTGIVLRRARMVRRRHRPSVRNARAPRGAGRRQLRVRIAHGREIAGPRPGVELGQQPVVALVGPGLRHPARRIVDVAEDDGLRRARRFAGRDDLAVADGARPRAWPATCARVDALHAVGALLHHAAAADGDVRVALHLERRRVPVGVEQEVEPPHLVGTVVRAIARARRSGCRPCRSGLRRCAPSRRPGRPPRTARSRSAGRARAGSGSSGLSTPPDQ